MLSSLALVRTQAPAAAEIYVSQIHFKKNLQNQIKLLYFVLQSTFKTIAT